MFIRVDLPAPFSPSSAWTSPSRRSKLTSSFATVPGKRFVMCSISRTTGRSGMRAIIVWPPHGRKPLGGQACRRDSALRARDLEVAVGDLLRDVVELGDQGVAIGRVRADLAVADAVVRDVVQRVAPTFEVAVDDLLDRVEHRDVDLLRGAREDVGAEERLVVVDPDAPGVALVRRLEGAETAAARRGEDDLRAPAELGERDLLALRLVDEVLRVALDHADLRDGRLGARLVAREERHDRRHLLAADRAHDPALGDGRSRDAGEVAALLLGEDQPARVRRFA